MSTEQHEALKLADMLGFVQSLTPMPKDAARLLRAQHALIVQMAEALESACDHIEMGALEVSHCKDHERITQAISAATQYLKGPKT